MSTAAPNPSNMLMLAVLGVGAYWYFSRRAMAAPTAGTPYGAAPRTAPSLGAQIAQWAASDRGLWSTIGRIIGPTSSAQTTAYQAANGANSGPVPQTGATGDAEVFPGNDYVVDNPAPGINYDDYFLDGVS